MTDLNKKIITGAAFFLMQLMDDSESARKPRRKWMTELFRKRNGAELLRDLKFEEITGQYHNFMRMSSSDFEFLLRLIAPKISKQETNMRSPISAQDRLAVTLRFLATGNSYTDLQYTFRISKQAISKIVPEVCSALIYVLKENIQIPKTEDGWKQIAKEFKKLWNFPFATGALDGKQVAINAPFHSGTEFHNYKSFFSIVLFALVDANYNFMFVDCGCQGRISDGGIFQDSALGRALESGTLNLPPDGCYTRTRRVKIPYVFLADSAFALTPHVMKPYGGDHKKGSPERIFNYRLSRARRVVENSFGILSSVFCVLRHPMELQPPTAEQVVLTICHLHNFLQRNAESRSRYTPPQSLDQEQDDGQIIHGSWRNEAQGSSFFPLRNVPRRSPNYPKKVRDELADYFVKEGAISWQNKCAYRYTIGNK